MKKNKYSIRLAVLAGLAILASPAYALETTYSDEAFEGASPGVPAVGAITGTHYDNTTTASNNNGVTIVANIAGGPLGQHVQLEKTATRHIGTQAGLLTLATDSITSIEVSYSVRFATANTGTNFKLRYSADGTFGDATTIFAINPGDAATPNKDVWYDLTTTIFATDVTGGFTDTAKFRWLTGTDKVTYLDDVKIVGDDTPLDGNPPPIPSFTIAPIALSFSEITMTAGAVVDPEGADVEYYFTCTSGDGHDSGWQASTEYTDRWMKAGTSCEYTVKSRDLSGGLNESLPSAASPAAITPAVPAGQKLYSFEDFDDVGLATGNPALGTNAFMDYDNTTTGTNNGVTVIANIAETLGANGQHMQLEKGDNRHISTEAGLLMLATDLIESVDVSFAVQYNNTNTRNLVLEYSALGDFSDTVEIFRRNPGDADTPVQQTWYHITETIYANEVTFTDAASFRWLTTIDKKTYLDDIIIVGNIASPDGNAPPIPAFTTAPIAISFAEITMTAGAVVDPEGKDVEYYFTCTSGGGNDSGWQASTEYTDSGLTPETTYEYTVKSRDTSFFLNESLPSAALSDTTPANTVTILASWDIFTDTALPIDADTAKWVVTAWISDPNDVLRDFQSNTGSTDGTYGSIQPGASTTDGRARINKAAAGDGDFAINITNTGLDPLTLDELLFDLEVVTKTGTQTHDTYSIVFENTTQGTTSAVLGTATLPTGWNDVDIDASSITLAAGDVGRFVVTLSNGTNEDNSGVLDNFAITTSSPVPENDFSNWIAGYFPGETDPAIIGLDADPDGDGVGSGVENFFGTAPDTFSQGLVSGTMSGGIFTFTHPLNATPADNLTAGYRWSKDLQGFNADGATDGEGTKVDFSVQLDTPTGYTTVTATVTGTAADKLFVDVEVTQP